MDVECLAWLLFFLFDLYQMLELTNTCTEAMPVSGKVRHTKRRLLNVSESDDRFTAVDV